MEDDEHLEKSLAESSVSRTSGGKIINKLEKNDVRDSNETEMTPDPFAAEQTYLTEDDIKNAKSQRKGSYDEMDQDMNAPKDDQINSGLDKNALENMFDNMQI